MSKKLVSASEFKAGCLKLMEEVSKSGQSLVVTKRGKPLVRVMPADGSSSEDDYALKDTISLQVDIVSPLGESLWEAARVLEVNRRSGKLSRAKPRAQARSKS